MKVNISSINFNSKYRIPRNVVENSLKERPFLYNDVVDLVKEHSVMSIFRVKGIDITNPSEKFLEAVKAKGIKIFKLKE